MATKKKTLPNRLSDLIEVAVADCKKVAADKRYRFNMRKWHYAMPAAKGMRVCSVCMAGAVMAKSLGAPFRAELGPGSFLESDALLSIDDVRTGSVGLAIARQGISRGTQKPHETTAIDAAAGAIRSRFNCTTRRAPWATYLKAARILREAGM